MFMVTTPTIEGKTIKEYKGVVFGEVINGANFIKDFSAGITNFLGGRAGVYEEEIINARSNALNEMVSRAHNLGANAIVDVKVDVETIGQSGSMIMVIASGTAVLTD